jgi:hypothetical protein
MKSIIRIPILILAALAVIFLSGCVPLSMIAMDEGLVIAQTYHLNSGETVDNDLTVIGANATLDQNSTVNGNIAVIGGTMTIDGNVNGDISVIGSDVSLGDHAVVHGSVDTVGGNVRRASGAVVEGRSVGNIPSIPRITTLRTPAMQVSIDPITAPLSAMFQALALAALAVVVNLFVPAPMERAGRTAVAVTAASGGVGCLTLLVLVVMAVTIILLPVSLLGMLVVGVAALFGWLAIGLLVGRQINILLKQSWTDPVNAGVGTLVITLLASLLNIIPCIGWTVSTLVGLVALGAVVLTRFGTQLYPSPYAAAPIPRPGPYAPPAAESPAPQPETPEPAEHMAPPEPEQPGENPPAGQEETNKE